MGGLGEQPAVVIRVHLKCRDPVGGGWTGRRPLSTGSGRSQQEEQSGQTAMMAMTTSNSTSVKPERLRTARKNVFMESPKDENHAWGVAGRRETTEETKPASGQDAQTGRRPASG